MCDSYLEANTWNSCRSDRSSSVEEDIKERKGEERGPQAHTLGVMAAKCKGGENCLQGAHDNYGDKGSSASKNLENDGKRERFDMLQSDVEMAMRYFFPFFFFFVSFQQHFEHDPAEIDEAKSRTRSFNNYRVVCAEFKRISKLVAVENSNSSNSFVYFPTLHHRNVFLNLKSQRKFVL